MQMQVKDFSKVPAWRLERIDSTNAPPRPTSSVTSAGYDISEVIYQVTMDFRAV